MTQPITTGTAPAAPQNAVMAAFAGGTRVVMAGELHSRIRHDEEIAIWRAQGVTVLYEEGALPLLPGHGLPAAIGLDSPLMGLVACAGEIVGLLTDEHVDEWVADGDRSRQKKLVDDFEAVDLAAGDSFAALRKELASTGASKDSPSAKKGEMLRNYVQSITDTVRTYHRATQMDRMRTAASTRAALRVNVVALRSEIKSALPLEDPSLAQFADRPTVARSAAMLLRLNRFAQYAAQPTVWKVGEDHINDAVALGGGHLAPVPGALVMPRPQYIAAFRQFLDPVRVAETQQFFRDNPNAVRPVMHYMYDKGWVS
ncbi:hypothetical protein [Micromonospora sp. DT231]|uniref:hypothetical protein n=1 Tax=Micromonospora sp. DT231 TaxID=3416526 RepID=UPI003CEE3979